jgi:hypothetical protein
MAHDPRTGQFPKGTPRGKPGVTIAVVKDVDKGWNQLLKGVDSLRRDPTELLEVGWFTPEIAERAARNEFGFGVPERPFVRPTIDGNQDRYLDMMQRGLDRVALGEARRETALVPAANAIRTDIIARIISTRTPPNAPATIAAKGSSNPLVDTGEMQRDLTVREGRGGGRDG